jgi:hypothetical protein
VLDLCSSEEELKVKLPPSPPKKRAKRTRSKSATLAPKHEQRAAPPPQNDEHRAVDEVVDLKPAMEEIAPAGPPAELNVAANEDVAAVEEDVKPKAEDAAAVEAGAGEDYGVRRERKRARSPSPAEAPAQRDEVPDAAFVAVAGVVAAELDGVASGGKEEQNPIKAEEEGEGDDASELSSVDEEVRLLSLFPSTADTLPSSSTPNDPFIARVAALALLPRYFSTTMRTTSTTTPQETTIPPSSSPLTTPLPTTPSLPECRLFARSSHPFQAMSTCPPSPSPPVNWKTATSPSLATTLAATHKSPFPLARPVRRTTSSTPNRRTTSA